jgi:hypothetical protein
VIETSHGQCQVEIASALKWRKKILIVYEADERKGGGPWAKLEAQCPHDLSVEQLPEEVFTAGASVIAKWRKQGGFERAARKSAFRTSQSETSEPGSLYTVNLKRKGSKDKLQQSAARLARKPLRSLTSGLPSRWLLATDRPVANQGARIETLFRRCQEPHGQ